MPWKTVDDRDMMTNVIVTANTFPELIEEIQKVIESNDQICHAQFTQRGTRGDWPSDPFGFNPRYREGVWSQAMQVIGLDWEKGTPEEEEELSYRFDLAMIQINEGRRTGLIKEASETQTIPDYC